MKELKADKYLCPIGELLIVADAEKLCLLEFNDNPQRIEKLLTKNHGLYELSFKPGVLDMQRRLDGYFSSDWNVFNDLDLQPGGTDFQCSVWDSLRRIPVGTTISYDQLAINIGNQKAVRAVASANARNPIAIIVPCHRVIGKDGSMTGYAGGIHRKEWLLNHEKAQFSKQSSLFM